MRGNHLQCDFRNSCVACSNYTWSSNIETHRKYFHCKYCNTDVLCKLGAAVSYNYEEGMIEKILKCSKCDEPLIEMEWPTMKILKNLIE